jgi:hypothetical protein
MKENKNLVFGLTSFKQVDSTFVPDGFLLFPDEDKAMLFIDLFNSLTAQAKTSHYEKFTWVKVNDYVGDRVNSQKQFYVKEATAYSPTEEDFQAQDKIIVE